MRIDIIRQRYALRAMQLDLHLRRSPLDSWLGLVLRVGAMSGCGLGLVLACVLLLWLATATDFDGLSWLIGTFLCSTALPMVSLPLFAIFFLRFTGRQLTIHEGQVILRKRALDGTIREVIARADLASVRASIRRGHYEKWGRKGLVLHMGIGPVPLAIGTIDPERAQSCGWVVAEGPELEVAPRELDALLFALGAV